MSVRELVARDAGDPSGSSVPWSQWWEVRCKGCGAVLEKFAYSKAEALEAAEGVPCRCSEEQPALF